MSAVPFTFAAGVNVTVGSASPVIHAGALNATFAAGTTVSSELVAVSVSVCDVPPLDSSSPPPVARPAIVIGVDAPESSETALGSLIAPIVGESFTSVTVTVNVVATLSGSAEPSLVPSSNAVTVMTAVPTASATGEKVIVGSASPRAV